MLIRKEGKAKFRFCIPLFWGGEICSPASCYYGSIDDVDHANHPSKVSLTTTPSTSEESSTVNSSSYDSEANEFVEVYDDDENDTVTDDAGSELSQGLRRTASFRQIDDEYDRVPSHLTDNIKLCVDRNLNHKQKGRLYFAEQALYNNQEKPDYAMTIKKDMFRMMIINEVEQAYNAPCGLYFCCHGGDGAHTGVSHVDYVDIRLAWVFVIAVFVTIAAVFL
ncbi:hypothetical protein IV203_013874 [Nitzschia inconspicua]|uniref:Uncharacterized protein n=1 Tax=Nitzschia inconspicua TaxID=303405 RepID=A0A9K3M5Y7_9STRA|nr:hypothetical protein IV203_013874 [Nitzschia inconspicua]